MNSRHVISSLTQALSALLLHRCARPLVGRLCCTYPQGPCAAQFGEIDIDSELVASKEYLEGGEDQQIMMLNNGCLCCTVNDDLIRMLGELVSPRESAW